MKNNIKSFFLVAMTALMLFSCTNVNDPTALLNTDGKTYAMFVDAILLDGLSKDFNGKEVEVSFSYVNGYDKENKATWKTETSKMKVGTDGTDALADGSSFVKLATPVKIVAYKNVLESDAIVKLSAKVDGKEVKVANVTLTEFKAAELSIPESAYNVAEKDYPHRYLKISTTSGSLDGKNIAADFAFVETPKKDDYEELIPFKVEVNYICSNIGNFELNAVEGDEPFYYATFVFENSKDGWSVDDGVFAFGITDDTSWTTKYTGATVTPITEGAWDSVKDSGVSTTKGHADNNKATLVDGKVYTVVVKVKGTTVNVAIYNTEIAKFASDPTVDFTFKDGLYTADVSKVADWGFGITNNGSWDMKFVGAEVGTEFVPLVFQGKDNNTVKKGVTPTKITVKIENGDVLAKFN
ncbi:MAG: hypothetical protein IJD23_11350 [Spirochaetaceae bacterium]|nr:hypothetical protein [Spirochaetaceae bacterium]